MPVRDDSALSQFYITQMRSFAKANMQHRVRWRPALNRDERLLAKETRQLVEKVTSGYRGGDTPPDLGTCLKCGGAVTKDNKIYKKIWYNNGEIAELRRCGMCGG